MKKVTRELADEFAQNFFGCFIENVKFDKVNYFEDYPQHTIEYTLGRAKLCIFQTYGADAPIQLCERPTPVGYLEIKAQHVAFLTMLDDGEVVPIEV